MVRDGVPEGENSQETLESEGWTCSFNCGVRDGGSRRKFQETIVQGKVGTDFVKLFPTLGRQKLALVF